MKWTVFNLTLWLSLSACSSGKFKGGTNSGTPAPSGDSVVEDPNGGGVVEDPKGDDAVQDPPIGTTIEGITNSPNTVVFGGSGVYRVGDGRAENTSCPQTVFAFELEGAEYSFVFVVEQDNTVISFNIGRLCGVDSDRTNLISVVDLGNSNEVEDASLERRVVADGEAPLAPFASALTLDKGQYALRVVSETIRGPISDRDDFVVGNIQLKADKPIKGTNIQTN